jgi:hypothetical protein
MEKAGINPAESRDAGLVVQTEERDDREDDCTEEDLGDVVVEDLLVGVRGIAVMVVLSCRLIASAEGFRRGGYVLRCGHSRDNSLGSQRRGFPLCSGSALRGEFPCCSRGKGVYNKGSPAPQGVFSRKKGVLSEMGMGGIRA